LTTDKIVSAALPCKRRIRLAVGLRAQRFVLRPRSVLQRSLIFSHSPSARLHVGPWKGLLR
jgi:hypothetical protein